MSDPPIELTLPTESELLRISGIENFVQSAREYMDPGEGKNEPTHVAIIYRAFLEALARAQFQSLDKAPDLFFSFRGKEFVVSKIAILSSNLATIVDSLFR